jgi:hypothetical protein
MHLTTPSIVGPALDEMLNTASFKHNQFISFAKVLASQASKVT